MVVNPIGGGTAGDSLVIAAPSVADPASSLALFVAVLAMLLVLSVLVGRTVRSSSDPNRSATDDETTTDSSERIGGSDSASSPSRRDVDSPVMGRGTDSSRRRSERPASSDEPVASTDEPVGKRDRVVALLEREGGQIRQSRIVTETGWSKTKVSRLLSSMDEDDEVVKIQIGRENLICLPGHVPSVSRDDDG